MESLSSWILGVIYYLFYNDPVTIQHPYPERCFCIRIIQLYKEVSYEQTNDLRYIQHFISKSCFLSRAVLLLSAGKKGKGHWAHTLIPYVKIPCLEQIPGKLQKALCKKQGRSAGNQKNGLTCSDIQLLFAGDLLAQTSASSFGTADLKIPFTVFFGACSTMGESLSLGSMCIDGGYGKYILCATSSHFASAEKEFRFPLGYGNQRPLSATWTVTGAGACILGYEPPPRPDNKNTKHTP